MSKTAQIIERINALETFFGKSGNQLGKEAGIGNGTVGGWNDNLIGKPSLAVEKFLRFYNVSEEWWKTGKGEVFNTPVQKDHALKEKLNTDLADAIRIIIEGSEYVVIPKVALEGKYRLMPLEEISIKEQELARRNDDMIRKDTQIQGLYELIKLMASGVAAGNPPKIEGTQKNTGV